MSAKITNPWKNSRMTGAEKEQRKVDRLLSDIANVERVLAWQQSEGYTEQAAYSVKELAKLNAKLAKLVD
jgi:hypothetical protein